MLISEFDYYLPPELIAQKPLAKRDESRMLVLYRQTGKIVHSFFRELPNFLSPQEVIVLNDSRVIPARVWGTCNGKEVDFLFLRPTGPRRWEVICRPARKVSPGARVIFPNGMGAHVWSRGPEGRRELELSIDDVIGWLRKAGYPPLPPYIKRRREDEGLRRLDLTRYQTIYARREGSIAAPTAGLHFTRGVLRQLRLKGVIIVKVTLDVGLATFQPVRVEKVEEHKMLDEFYAISSASARNINQAKKEGRPVLAVGTTVVRTLESAAETKGRETRVMPGPGSTRLFIYPGYQFQIVDRLLTNFHLPRSTLLMLVAAFAGRDLILKAYEEAVREKYRFFSYGDCMLIL